MSLTLATLVAEHAARRPDHPFLHSCGHTVSYAEMDARTDRVADALRAAGVRPGDRVALLDKNGPACLEVMFASAKCGAAYTPLSWRLARPELAAILADAAPAVLLVGAEFADAVPEIARNVPFVLSLAEYDTWVQAAPTVAAGPYPTPPPAPLDMALLMYTSGTTGRAKGAVLTHASLLNRMPGHGAMWRYDETSVNLVGMPLFHIGGTGILLEGIVAGASTVLMREFDPKLALDLIGRHGVTNTLLVPAMIQFMLDSPGCADVDWSSMRALIYGAAPISQTLLRRAMEVMRCEFVQIYGMTEHSGVCASLPAEAHDPARPELLASCGRPFPWVELMVADPASGEPAAPGEVGEIWLRSDQVMRGYWGRPAETAAAITSEGWYRTGDAGRQDEQGYLYLSDRVKDMIISGGENVYPAEIENVLTAHPEVRDVAVIGVPHERWGETPKALVVTVPGAGVSAADLITFCRSRLAGFKCPTSVDFVDSLPRNASGKILKFELREPYWAGHTRRVG